jgi:hypothetical protein
LKSTQLLTMRESCGWVLEGFVTPARVAVPRAKILSARTTHYKPLTIDDTRSCRFECLACASALARVGRPSLLIDLSADPGRN